VAEINDGDHRPEAGKMMTVGSTPGISFRFRQQGASGRPGGEGGVVGRAPGGLWRRRDAVPVAARSVRVCRTRPERKRAAREDRIGESEAVSGSFLSPHGRLRGGVNRSAEIERRRELQRDASSARKTTGAGVGLGPVCCTGR
jgi:hypothetical protein